MLIIDALRGAAALYILVHHIACAHGQTYAVGNPLTDSLLYGHLAVTLFIVLSGYCLGVSKPRNTLQFYWQRLKRILPVFYGTVAVSALLLMTLARIRGASYFFQHERWLVNFLTMNDLYPDLSFSYPLWILALNIKIYAWFPLLAWLYCKWGKYALAVGAIALTVFLSKYSQYCPWYGLLFALGFYASQEQIDPRIGYVCAGIFSAMLLIFPFQPGALGFHSHLLEFDLIFGVIAGAFLSWQIKPSKRLQVKPSKRLHGLELSHSVSTPSSGPLSSLSNH